MIFIILIILAVVVAVGIDALLHPEKQEEARARIAAQKQAKTAAKKHVKKKYMPVVTDGDDFQVIQDRFDNKQFEMNAMYDAPIRELEEAGYSEGDIVYKWEIDPLTCRIELKDDRADVYASADETEFEYIGYIPNVTGKRREFLDGASVRITAEGSTSYEIGSSDTGALVKENQKYRPWEFMVIAEKLVDNGK